MDFPTKLLLQRTPLNSELKDLLDDVKRNLPELGNLLKVEPILEGYEDANFLVESNKGKFVLKVFSKGRPEAFIKDYKNVLLELKNANIPSLELVGPEEQLFNFEDGSAKVWYFVTKFFDGFNFSDRQPSVTDLEETATILAKLNSIQLRVSGDYDSWGNKNLVKEFEASKGNLSSEVLALVEPVVSAVATINFEGFSESLIHGDMQKKHVLRNMRGEYCIIDFGCMAYDKRVYELSTYLAWFVYDELTMMRRDELFNIVLDSYTKIVPLCKNEIESLDTLTKASYASYFMKTWLLIANGDTSPETKVWHESSKRLLIAFE